ncbi:vanadium-dependent haloperoxidase [Winogradskyella echinorum]|uniref:Vanadium-dependent haloperoxidase n=1 Tax=Winogradskyella echinorum TaxID=538189 RepID=A0ABR6Y2Q5_9FLAO|nr:vanadium-dependent haloperoxidase [Winogradskyella echinorum]MBC3847026.1 vanadium-dependent haloperoxidase [Winogradskyella echinorum]MBC5751374.1 vanadium-dependent haloperoxidase [Winogradskyella echinorum]
MKHTSSILSVIIFLICFSCKKEELPINITTEDYHNSVDKLTEVMIHDIFSPPVASRIYAYPNIAAYETLNQNNASYKSLGNQLNGLTKLKSEKADASTNLKLASLIAYIDVAKELVFSKERITAYRDSLYSNWKTLNHEDFNKAKDFGLEISEQIIAWMNADNYAETRTMPDYNIYTDDPSRWEPTPPAYMKGIEPSWNKLRPFVLDSAAQFKPITHPKFSLEKGTAFHNELMEVFNINNAIRAKGDDSEEIAMARFWDCNPFVSVNKGHFMFAKKKITPGAHWIGICKIACKQTNSDFEKTVYAYTKTSLAVADAFISCWDEKYRSNLIRPETLINKYIDLEWAPILQTPPFPEYTSGHSVVSGASSEVLTEIFGDNFAFDDTTELPFGLPMRSFKSFRLAAKEAALSRLYGGIHYRAAIEVGLDQGIALGTLVNAKISFLK